MNLCSIDWDIAVRLTDALAWPFVTILGILLLKPLVRGIVDAFTRNGGKFSVAGIDAELNADRVEEAAQAIIKNAPDQPADPQLEELRVALREMSSEELYYQVTGAWKEVSIAISLAYEKKTGGTLDWRSGQISIGKAKKAGLLNGTEADAVDDLFAVRASAKRRGPEDFRGMEMDADDVFTYIQATKSLAQQIAGK